MKNLTICRKYYGSYTIEGVYRGKSLKVFTTDSILIDRLEDEENKNHTAAMRAVAALFRQAYEDAREINVKYNNN